MLILLVSVVMLVRLDAAGKRHGLRSEPHLKRGKSFSDCLGRSHPACQGAAPRGVRLVLWCRNLASAIGADYARKQLTKKLLFQEGSL